MVLLNQGYPPCTPNSYLTTGMIDISNMLYNCSNNMVGSLMPPSMFTTNMDGVYHPTNVSIGITLNSLVFVDAVQSQMTLDYFLKLQWQDPRWFMPGLFQHLNPEATHEGFDITLYINNQNAPLNIWLPDIFFYETASTSQFAELLKIYPNGTIYWSRQFQATLTEEAMQFVDYPLNNQNFTMTAESYAWDTAFLNLNLYEPPVELNVYSQSSLVPSIDQNQLWTYLGYTASTKIIKTPTLLNPKRTYSTVYFTIAFEPQSFGIIYRLAMPVIIFVVIAGFSLYADKDKRIDVTLQMVLVVAAMYIVVGQSIPQVGYLTRMDIFIIGVFIALSFLVGLHFIVAKLDDSIWKYPFNAFVRDFIMFVCRMFWIPLALITFTATFEAQNDPFIVSVTVISTTATVLSQMNKIGDLVLSFRSSLLFLRLKHIQLQTSKRQSHDSRDVAKKLKVKKVTDGEHFVLYCTKRMNLEDLEYLWTELESLSESEEINFGVLGWDDRNSMHSNEHVEALRARSSVLLHHKKTVGRALPTGSAGAASSSRAGSTSLLPPHTSDAHTSEALHKPRDIKVRFQHPSVVKQSGGGDKSASEMTQRNILLRHFTFRVPKADDRSDKSTSSSERPDSEVCINVAACSATDVNICAEAPEPVNSPMATFAAAETNAEL